ncbi:MAG TPA: hypothetical protein VJP88_10215 [Caulobacteraceae bacterium]|nr:hypothetical protein [Caulobacteraceae bacterium]
MTDAELVALRDDAQHYFHAIQRAVKRGETADNVGEMLSQMADKLKTLDTEVAARLTAGGAAVKPMDGDPKPQ